MVTERWEPSSANVPLKSVPNVRAVVDINHLGHRAFESCKSLIQVNIANTGHILHMHTFAQCHSLETIMLPICLREQKFLQVANPWGG